MLDIWHREFLSEISKQWWKCDKHVGSDSWRVTKQLKKVFLGYRDVLIGCESVCQRKTFGPLNWWAEPTSKKSSEILSLFYTLSLIFFFSLSLYLLHTHTHRVLDKIEDGFSLSLSFTQSTAREREERIWCFECTFRGLFYMFCEDK